MKRHDFQHTNSASALTSERSRREFLRGLSGAICAGVGSTFLPQLGLMGTALAATRGGLPGYKALVCVYLAGGNDSFNLLVPRDSTAVGSRYSTYRNSRGGIYNSGSNPLGLALDFNALLDVGSPIGQSTAFGLHPQTADYVATRNGNSYTYPGLRTLFGASQQKLALIANVGTLVQPTSMTQFNAGVPKPPQLYSHSDQEVLWNLANSDTNARNGWGGKIMDRLDPGGNPSLPPCISVAGNTRFQVGASVFPYQMSPGTGVTQFNNFSGTFTYGDQRRAALDALLAMSTPHLLQGEYRDIISRSRELSLLLSAALASNAGRILTPYDYQGGSPPSPAGNFYPNANLNLLGSDYPNSLLDQLRMVARMIKISRDPAAGVDQSRQIYYVRLGGFDTHSNQMLDQPLLTARISQALGWFWQALGEIGAQDDVTTFTNSEFGRTLSSNGNGSDHAWGGPVGADKWFEIKCSQFNLLLQSNANNLNLQKQHRHIGLRNNQATCPVARPLTLHTNNLLKRKHNFHQITLRRHYIFNRFIRGRAFINHIAIFTAFNPQRRFTMLFQGDALFCLSAAHHPPCPVRARTKALRVAQTPHNEAFCAHGAWNNPHLTLLRADRTFARDEQRFAKMLFALDIVVVAIHCLINDLKALTDMPT